jgi:putative MATE family efflux protein
MKDLTKDSVTRHILVMAAPIAMTMLTQIAYQLITLYFITQLGVAATAGVNAAGSVTFFVVAITQVLSIGTVSLIAQAIGRKDSPDATVVFNQSICLSVICATMMAALLYAVRYPYMRTIAADDAIVDAGATFMLWTLPGYALTLPQAVLASVLRGSGLAQPTFIVYSLTIVINAILAPVLIVGWGTGIAFGAEGAGLANSISTGIGVIGMSICFKRFQHFVVFEPRLMRPRSKHWRRIIGIGLPASSEFALTFLSTAVTYYAIRNFGAAAQAGFSIGSRVLQTIVLPGMSIAYAAGPIAGQNFGASKSARVIETFYKAAALGAAVMIVTTVLVQWRTTTLVRIFAADDSTVATATFFLQLLSWTLVVQGLVYTCSTMFQGLGNTLPALISSLLRFLAFSIPAVLLSTQSEFRIEQVWYLWIASIALQAVVSLWLLKVEFNRRLLPLTQ